MNRKKVTDVLSPKCLGTIRKFKQTTGLETRSRVIEELTYAIEELLVYKEKFDNEIQPEIIKPNPTQSEMMSRIFLIMDTVSKWSTILDRFQRFSEETQTEEEEDLSEELPPKKYRRVPPEERKQK